VFFSLLGCLNFCSLWCYFVLLNREDLVSDHDLSQSD
jgi:hypothetical protein